MSTLNDFGSDKESVVRLSPSDAMDEVERGVIRKIELRNCSSHDERPLLSVPNSDFYRLSEIYLPSPAFDEATRTAPHSPPQRPAEVGHLRSSLRRSQRNLLQSNQIQDLVLQTVLDRGGAAESIQDRVEWSHALDPEDDKTEDFFHAGLLRETSQCNNMLLSPLDHHHPQREPPDPTNDGGNNNNDNNTPKKHRRAPTRSSITLSLINEQQPLLDEAELEGEYSFLQTRSAFNDDNHHNNNNNNSDEEVTSPLSNDVSDGDDNDNNNTNTGSIFRSRKNEKKQRRCFFLSRLCLASVMAVFSSHLIRASSVLCAVALLLFHHGDPKIDIVGAIPISWWLNFAARLVLTLQLAKWAQFILIDMLVLSCRSVASLFGPLITVWIIQARGVNFTISAWGVLNSLLLHGDNDFQVNWFYWTGWDIYNRKDFGVKILSSDVYSRMLIAMMLFGIIASVKRTWFGVIFDRKILKQFKPKLLKILQDIAILSEVADLGDEAENQLEKLVSPQMYGDRQRGLDTVASGLKNKKGGLRDIADVSFNVANAHDCPGSKNDDDDDEVDAELKGLKQELIDDSLRTSDGPLLIRDQLDHWIPPLTKGDKGPEASIKEVLSFRRVLMMMDYSEPFGASFGPAATRDECIVSAHRVYQQLLLLNESFNRNLSFDVTSIITKSRTGVIDKAKLYQLRRVFRPDKENELSIVAFVQSCDSVYRRFRYFRATVNNASVLDQAVENMFDFFFYAALILSVSAFLGLNPLPVLLSVSTLMVSLSFAMSSSAANFVEGVLLVLIRSPYDLGDRILLTDPTIDNQPAIGNSYLVSDINLFSTTLTHSGTNQVATIKNGALKLSRIINLNRSSTAVCEIDFFMSFNVLDDGKADSISDDIQKYCQDNPRSWANLESARIENVCSSSEQVTMRFHVRHRNSWQDAASVLRDRGLLLQYIHHCAKRHRCHYLNLPTSTVYYGGGKLVHGAMDEDTTRSALLTNSNIVPADPSVAAKVPISDI